MLPNRAKHHNDREDWKKEFLTTIDYHQYD